MNRYFIFAVLLNAVAAWQQAVAAPTDSPLPPAVAVDTPFPQQYHSRYVLPGEQAANDVRAVTIDHKGNVWVASRAGVFRLGKERQSWTSQLPPAAAGPAFALAVEENGTVWAGVWDGLYYSGHEGLVKIASVSAPISTVCIDHGDLVALGPQGFWRVRNGLATKEPIACCQATRAALPDGEGGLWVATQMGLYHHTANLATNGYYQNDQLISADVRAIAYAKDAQLWVGSLGGISVLHRAGRVRQFTAAEGLANVDLRCIRRGPDGRMWVGSHLGISVYDGSSWSLRHSRRWLVGDQVRDIAFDQEGTAWIATNTGVSAIGRKSLTLAEKAAHYDHICQTRHVRPPGLVEKCRLATPGDTSTWKPFDDDNDGQYTSMYLAMESFRYAATKDPRAKANARRAFDALRFLQTVTETAGFVARTVVPCNWKLRHDPNRHFSDPQWASRLVEDPRAKRVEVRWHRSADGKWLWKGDTSSDEITGHYYGYLYYYDLVADETERKRVRHHVRKVTDSIINNG